ncbi:hypothetical protein TI05_03940 [Achromatium sp. WMS3]|nr:hypothetical protein TI05_03940 [Achromatium sp. WMS3]
MLILANVFALNILSSAANGFADCGGIYQMLWVSIFYLTDVLDLKKLSIDQGHWLIVDYFC